MSGLIGKKIGMTSIYDENGKNLPCTVIEAGPCVVTQVKTNEVDGYNAVQLGFTDKNDKHTYVCPASCLSSSSKSIYLVSFDSFVDIVIIKLNTFILNYNY